MHGGLRLAAILFTLTVVGCPSSQLPVQDTNDVDGDGWLHPEDCDDRNASVHPQAEELCDGLDTDCDLVIDGGFEGDEDGDGVAACAGDCDDGDPTVAPGFAEACDGRDNDCDGSLLSDEGDEDGDGARACNTDCDDTTPWVRPFAFELCDGIDNDCDGVAEVDGDGDGAFPCAWDACAVAITPPLDVDCQAIGRDCDDDDPAVFPLAEDVCDGGLDNDCDPDTVESCPADDLDGDGLLVGDDPNDALRWTPPAALTEDSPIWQGLAAATAAAGSPEVPGFLADLVRGFAELEGPTCPTLTEGALSSTPASWSDGATCTQELSLDGCGSGSVTLALDWEGLDQSEGRPGGFGSASLLASLELPGGSSIDGSVSSVGDFDDEGDIGWFNRTELTQTADLEVRSGDGGDLHPWLVDGTTELAVTRSQEFAYDLDLDLDVISALTSGRFLTSEGTWSSGGVDASWSLSWSEIRFRNLARPYEPNEGTWGSCLSEPEVGTLTVTDGVVTVEALWDGARCDGCADLRLDGADVGRWCPDLRAAVSMAEPDVASTMGCGP